MSFYKCLLFILRMFHLFIKKYIIQSSLLLSSNFYISSLKLSLEQTVRLAVLELSLGAQGSKVMLCKAWSHKKQMWTRQFQLTYRQSLWQCCEARLHNSNTIYMVTSCVWLFVTLWTEAHHSSAQGIFQARIIERGAISYSRDWTHLSCISCIDKQILYH